MDGCPSRETKERVAERRKSIEGRQIEDLEDAKHVARPEVHSGRVNLPVSLPDPLFRLGN